MSLLEEVTTDVDNYLAGTYDVTKPQDVPESDEVPLGKKAMEFEATALFVDVRQSTDVTDSFRRQTAAKMTKAYFSGAVRIINRNGGAVRSFNGDGMLAFFIGGTRTSPSVKSAMQIDWFVTELLRPKFEKYFENNKSALGKALTFEVGCGIDDGWIYAVKVGIRGGHERCRLGRARHEHGCQTFKRRVRNAKHLHHRSCVRPAARLGEAVKGRGHVVGHEFHGHRRHEPRCPVDHVPLVARIDRIAAPYERAAVGHRTSKISGVSGFSAAGPQSSRPIASAGEVSPIRPRVLAADPIGSSGNSLSHSGARCWGSRLAS